MVVKIAHNHLCNSWLIFVKLLSIIYMVYDSIDTRAFEVPTKHAQTCPVHWRMRMKVHVHS